MRSPCEKARIADVQEKTRKSKTRQERAAVFFACFASGCGQRLLLIQRIEPAHRLADLLVRHVVAAAFLDHIVPRSQGGESCWESVVWSCIDCNVRKGGRTPKHAHMGLIRRPEKPKRSPMLNLKHSSKKYQSWKTFLDNAYWSVGLK